MKSNEELFYTGKILTELLKEFEDDDKANHIFNIIKRCKVKNNKSDQQFAEKEIILLVKDLLKGANILMNKPYFIVQPFLTIIKKHKNTINIIYDN